MDEEKLSPEVKKYLDNKSTLDDSEKLDTKSIERIPKALREVGVEVANISGTWNPVEFYTASNMRAEKSKLLEAFSKDEKYNPKFEYDAIDDLDLTKARDKLRVIYHDKLLPFKPTSKLERIARVALRYKILDDIATCDLAEGLQQKDEEKIKKALTRKYPGTDPALLLAGEENYRILINPEIPDQGRLTDEEVSWLKNNNLNAEQIKSAFEWALEQYGIIRTEEHPEGFQVIISDETTSIDVRDKSASGPTIFIPADREISGDKLLLLIAHEVEGHARQSVNGQKLFGLGGGALKIDNEMLYEGLGMRYEEEVARELFGVREKRPKRFFDKAVELAEAGSDFYDIFSEIYKMELRKELHIAPETPLPEDIDEEISTAAQNGAWITTYRVMRGHIDTSNMAKFAMAKDLAYLRGWLMDKQLRENELGAINESAVIASDALPLIAHFHLEEKDLPHPYQNLARKYWDEVLKPQYEETQKSS